LKKKVESTWNYPPGISGTQTVLLRFVLDIDGKLVSAEVVNSTVARLSNAALKAMNRASLFPPVPEELKNIAN
jgi:TonB family protein